MLASASFSGDALIATIAGIVAIAAALGAAFAVFRTNLASATINLLKENNEALQEQNDIQERTIQDQKGQILALQARVSKVELENGMLKERVDAKAVLESVSNDTARILALLEKRRPQP